MPGKLDQHVAQTGAALAIRRLLAALCIVGLLATGIGLTIFFLTQKDSLGTPTPRTPSALQPSGPSMPTPAEWKIAAEVTGQDCPAPDKCTFTYSVKPNYTGNHPLPDNDFTVFYDVIGGFAPQSSSFTVSDGQARIFKDVLIDGPPGAQLSVNVTKVSAVAGPKPVS